MMRPALVMLVIGLGLMALAGPKPAPTTPAHVVVALQERPAAGVREDHNYGTPVTLREALAQDPPLVIDDDCVFTIDGDREKRVTFFLASPLVSHLVVLDGRVILIEGVSK